MHTLLKSWNLDIQMVNGRPRHSQSQGLIERGNREVEKKLSKMKSDKGISDKVTLGSLGYQRLCTL